ncbi:MAG: hemerythrin domain-containing protein [Betaproteobacteria bacterium]|nr:hemerythrin domain-containing protein [Betaproteobacteria bacterium]
MKRDPGLRRFSREHHAALVLAKRVQRMAAEEWQLTTPLIAEVLAIFARDIEPHFQAEEKGLLPSLQTEGTRPLAERTWAEHQMLRALVDRLAAGDAASLAPFGEALDAHVRFEERELFPAAQSVLAPETLSRIGRSDYPAHQRNTHIQGTR